MLLPVSWLREYLKTSASAEEIADKLVQLGHEVEGMHSTAPAFNGVVIGKVLSREQHPDADRLGVCMVDIGAGEPQQIVCGAPNARAGLTVAVATVGAVLPGDFKIKKSKIRGVESNGMICAEDELGLGDDHDGIMELQTDLPVGTDFMNYLPPSETIIDVDVTPNRGDCLSVYGMARDLAATGIGELKSKPDADAGKSALAITCATETSKCSFFSGITVTGVKNTGSPAWLKQRLEAAGLRPRNAVVDVSNYVMLTFGQPLHTYDADRLPAKNIAATAASGGEEYVGIGDVKVTCAEGDILITSGKKMIGLGAILGGESTAVTDDTTNVYIEAAWFERSQIALTGQRLQLHTDARSRFERGIDPAQTAWAGRYAAKLIQEICGGEISEQECVGSADQKLPTIEFDPSLTKIFGGHYIPVAEQKEWLARLGFGIEEKAQTLCLTPPTWRTYMVNSEDVVEELLRLADYEKVEATLPKPMKSRQNISNEAHTLDRLMRKNLANLGFLECISYSFIADELAVQFAENKNELMQLANPIDEATMSTLRPSLMPGLLTAAKDNLARSLNVTRLFEVGKVFGMKAEKLSAMGILLPETKRNWSGIEQNADCFAAKGALYQLLEQLDIATDRLKVSTDKLPSYMHPGRSGVVALGPNAFGLFGELHPSVCQQFDLPAQVGVFELYLSTINQQKAVKPKAYQHSVYQPVARDIALLVDAETLGGDVMQTIQTATKELATEVTLFDVYEGDKLPAGKKSLAFNLVFQAPDRTLSDAEITAQVKTAVEACQKHYGAQLRDA